MSAKFVTWDGQQFVKTGEKLYVGPLTMHLLNSYRGRIME